MLLGPRLKIERAKQHITDFNNEAAAFNARNPYRIVIEPHPERSGIMNFTVRVMEEFPDRLTCVVGDAIHNLRTALDLMIFNLVAPTNADMASRVQFPFAKSANSLKPTIDTRHIRRAGKEVVDAIIALEPYPGGNRAGQMLADLHNLDIADKHKLLIGVESLAVPPDFQIADGDRIVATFSSNSFSAKDGSIVLQMPMPENAKVGDYIYASPHIVFRQGQPFERKPITPTLIQLTELVEQTIAYIAGAAGLI